MSRYLLPSLVFLQIFFCCGNATAQNDSTKKIETRYLRPTVINVFSNKSEDEKHAMEINTLISNFKNARMINKFDDFKLNSTVVNVPSIDDENSHILTLDDAYICSENADKKYKKKKSSIKRTLRTAKEAYRAFKGKNHSIDGETEEKYQMALQPVAKETIAKWFNRDQYGNFTLDTIILRGKRSILDKDQIIDKNSMVKRSSNIGKKLIDRTYFFAYSIDSLQTLEELYEECQTESNNRTEKGYKARVSVVVYKLNFDDKKDYYDFSERLYTDKESHDKQKVKEWENAKFNVGYVTNISFNKVIAVSKTSSTDIASLLHELPDKIQDRAIEVISKLDRNLRVKTDVFQEDPLTAKIGMKEDLYVDKRFFVFRKELDEEHNREVEKRVAVVKVRPMYSWDTGIASGNTIPSRFQQQGGKKIYNGYYFEEREDWGVNLLVGGNLLKSPVSGLSLGVEANLSRIVSKSLRNTFPDLVRHIPGGINLGWVYNNSLGHNMDNMVNDTIKSKASFEGYCFYLSWDYYVTKKGLIYLTPTLGFNGISHIYHKDSTGTFIKGYGNSNIWRLGAAVSYNINPYLSGSLGLNGIMGKSYDGITLKQGGYLSIAASIKIKL